MSFSRYALTPALTLSLLSPGVPNPVYAGDKVQRKAAEEPAKQPECSPDLARILDEYKDYEITVADLLELMTDYNITHPEFCLSDSTVVAGSFDPVTRTVCMSAQRDRIDNLDTSAHEAWHYILRRAGVHYSGSEKAGKDDGACVERFVSEKAKRTYKRWLTPAVRR